MILLNLKDYIERSMYNSLYSSIYRFQQQQSFFSSNTASIFIQLPYLRLQLLSVSTSAAYLDLLSSASYHLFTSCPLLSYLLFSSGSLFQLFSTPMRSITVLQIPSLLQPIFPFRSHLIIILYPIYPISPLLFFSSIYNSTL